jgi:ubiquinone/menaquinone biosynthesis C-methylase UbiE
VAYSEKLDFDEKISTRNAMYSRLKRYCMPVNVPTAKLLDIGGAGGLFGGLLSAEFERVIVADIIDLQEDTGGNFARLLKEKFIRNGHDLSLKKIEFHVCDAMDLPYKDNCFDMVVSINAFEHIPDPALALKEAIRVVKKGGVVYATFDPVWTADSGSHFYHLVPEPWRHLVIDMESFGDELRDAGADDGLINEFRYALNRKPASFYRDDFPRLLTEIGVQGFYMDSWCGCTREEYRYHPNRSTAAKALGCSEDDLLIRGFALCIQK